MNADEANFNRLPFIVLRPLFLHSNGVIVVVIFLSDVKNQKKTENRRKNNEERFQVVGITSTKRSISITFLIFFIRFSNPIKRNYLTLLCYINVQAFYFFPTKYHRTHTIQLMLNGEMDRFYFWAQIMS